LTGDGIDPADVLSRVGIADGVDIFVFADPDTLVASTLDGAAGPRAPGARPRPAAVKNDF
jgi:two-component system sensor histidine kinase ChvG